MTGLRFDSFLFFDLVEERMMMACDVYGAIE